MLTADMVAPTVGTITLAEHFAAAAMQRRACIPPASAAVGLAPTPPGGGTFHAVVHEHEGGHAFSLVDDPFERVPQGGPGLSAEAARAHEDLPFVWWVADLVMERDRRAWWMRHWLVGTACIQTIEVFERREPILYVSHDADDGLWQLIGTSDAADTGKIGHLHHAVDEGPTLLDVLDLSPGQDASRRRIGGPWERDGHA